MTKEQMLEKVEEFSKLKDDWDGYGAYKIEDSTVKLSKDLINSEIVKDYTGGVFPCSEGHIHFFKDIEETSDIEVCPEGFLIWLSEYQEEPILCKTIADCSKLLGV